MECLLCQTLRRGSTAIDSFEQTESPLVLVGFGAIHAPNGMSGVDFKNLKLQARQRQI
jgi:hypothetical protein